MPAASSSNSPQQRREQQQPGGRQRHGSSRAGPQTARQGLGGPRRLGAASAAKSWGLVVRLLLARRDDWGSRPTIIVAYAATATATDHHRRRFCLVWWGVSVEGAGAHPRAGAHDEGMAPQAAFTEKKKGEPSLVGAARPSAKERGERRERQAERPAAVADACDACLPASACLLIVPASISIDQFVGRPILLLSRLGN